MKPFFLSLLIALPFISALGQTTTIDFESKQLKETRKIRIHVPEVSPADASALPVIFTLDGEYMFYNLVAAMELLSTSEYMSKAIVVGIDQNYPSLNSEKFQRWIDCDYNGKSGLLEGNGVIFKLFLETELLPFIQNNYSCSSFCVLAGHSFTANFIFYSLFDSTNPFKGFLAFSPYIADGLIPSLASRIDSIQSTKYLYLSTSLNDLSFHKSSLVKYDSLIFQHVSNSKFHYQFDLLPNETHMTLTYPSAFEGLKFLFADYAPLYKSEQPMMDSLENYIAFLVRRYEHIQNTYGIELDYREEDLLELSWIAGENEQWGQVKSLAQLHIDMYPKSNYGYYTLGGYYEAQQNYPEALKNYEMGYSLLSPDITNTSDFYEDIERIKKLMK